jgi:mannosyltransferase OCH1-like enzyme
MIEKNIFQSWNTRDLPKPVQDRIDNFKAMNPDYKYQLYIDEEMDKFVNDTYPGEIADAYNKLNIIVAKVDLWRYLILYTYGGVYLDLDSDILKPLNTLIKDTDEAIITSEGHAQNDGAPQRFICYVQWGLIFKKGHPILKKTVDMIVENIHTNKFPNDILKMTGPVVFTNAVKEIHKKLFNEDTPHWSNENSMDNTMDKTFSKDGISYRIFGTDYNGWFTYKVKDSSMYTGKAHWRDEQGQKPLLKGGRRRKTRNLNRNRNRKRKRSLTSATRRRTSVARL